MNNRFLGCCFALPDLNNNNDIKKKTPKRKEMEPLCLADSQMNTPSGFSAEINMQYVQKLEWARDAHCFDLMVVRAERVGCLTWLILLNAKYLNCPTICNYQLLQTKHGFKPK